MRTPPRPSVRGVLTLLTTLLLAGWAGSPDTSRGYTASTSSSTTPDVDPARNIIEYGVMIDAEEDGDADCHIGINNDAPKGR